MISKKTNASSTSSKLRQSTVMSRILVNRHWALLKFPLRSVHQKNILFLSSNSEQETISEFQPRKAFQKSGNQ
ncbi:hypothetical protein DLM75_17715 [Leptospira stimsonii]|uniref:Uncharacterized protein n=1 Tax=Leptospira stimsonii TaxID=2202203 RepID=A0A396YXM0_9LEPT|nr:hypothetical protein DLM75_17715 [Leptospira stimsonii]